jgi:hypothetical protein
MWKEHSSLYGAVCLLTAVSAYPLLTKRAQCVRNGEIVITSLRPSHLTDFEKKKKERNENDHERHWINII